MICCKSTKEINGGVQSVNRRTLMMSVAALAGTALSGSSASGHAFWFLPRIDAGSMPLLAAIDDATLMGVKSNVNVGWANLIARAAGKAGIPAKAEHEIEYDLLYDPSRWGDKRALLVLGADVVLKPKAPVTKDVRGLKMDLYPAGLSKEEWDAWMAAFTGGFKYADIDPYGASEKFQIKSPFALIVDIDGLVSPHVFGWQAGIVCVASRDFGAGGGIVNVLASNVRFANADGRWKALAKGARRKVTTTPEVRDPALKPEQTAPSGVTKVR